MDTPPSQGPSTLAQAEEIRKDQGSHECEVSVCTEATAAEADLHKHYQYCKKNPAHKPFIPVKKFTMKHLPQRYRDNDILEFIKTMIYLTVRVCVRYTSFDRPETYPDTDGPYPFYNLRGKKILKTGSGMVNRVTDYTTDENKRKWGKEGETCPCEPCKHSPTPMTQWYAADVHTATHVVFDTAEAKHTTYQLFYDSEEEKNKIVELKGGVVWDRDIEGDDCSIYCYIHDLVLGKRLEEMVRLYWDLSYKVTDKWENCGIEHPLTVIVSHPHGCSKQVTVGEMEHREVLVEDFMEEEEVDSTNENEWVCLDSAIYTYTTATCRGSSGAPVFVLGRDDLMSVLPVHSRGFDGFNMSAEGFEEYIPDFL